MDASTRAALALRLLLGAACGLPVSPALGGEVPAKVRTLCQTCHGENGVAVLPGAANLAGQQKEYLVQQLRAYRSGSRRSEQMSIIAKTLTDGEIENVAEWYSAIKVTVEVPK